MGRHLRGGGHRLAAPAALAAVLILLGADVAGAHTALLRARADAHTLTLTFATPSAAARTEVALLAETGGRVETGVPVNPAGRPEQVVFPLAAALRPGRYVARWGNASEDGHVVAGSFDFRLRAAPRTSRAARTSAPAPAAATAVASTPRAATPAAVRTGLAVMRVLQDAALALAFGLLVFLGTVWRHGAGAVTERLRALLLGAAAAGAASAAVAVALSGAAFASLTDFLGTRAGLAWVLATVAWLAVAALARRAALLVLAVPVALLVYSPPLRGHAGALDPVVVLHVTAVSAWSGGLVALLVAARERPLADVVRRFGWIALPCAVVLGVTGVLEASQALGGLDQLLSTGYGRALALKSAVFALALAVAAYHRSGLLARGVRHAVALEVALAAVAMGAAGVLAGTAPPG